MAISPNPFDAGSRRYLLHDQYRPVDRRVCRTPLARLQPYAVTLRPEQPPSWQHHRRPEGTSRPTSTAATTPGRLLVCARIFDGNL